MATRPGSPINLAQLLGKKGFVSEAKRRQAEAAESLAASQTLLSPTDVIGEYDAARHLKTTLGGKMRMLTLDDLRAFQDSARKLGKAFKGGVTAKGVIESSLQIDRDRANEQIRTAVVVNAKAGVLHFITNAGPDSKDIRHHVHVQFPAFKAFAASPIKADLLARNMLQGKLSFGCDCGRARFYYDYLATIGGYKFGAPQPNFPKIRNPRLAGLGCKHALRVMQAVLRDGHVKVAAGQMIAAAQAQSNKGHTVTAAEAKATAERQIQQAHHVKNKVETQAQAVDRRSKTTLGRARAVQAAAVEAQRRAKVTAAASRKGLEDAFKKLQNAPMTKAMRDQMIARLMSMNTTD